MNDGKEFVIRHREYITDIYSGVAGSPGAPAPSPFKIQSFSLNPGMIETYPWLSNVAGRFEEYNIEGMLFEYKSMYSDAAVQTGGSLGQRYYGYQLQCCEAVVCEQDRNGEL